jgi:Rod binding domain-containing protein
MEVSGVHLPITSLKQQGELAGLSLLTNKEDLMEGHDEEARLKRVGEGFDAMFARVLFREMRKSVMKSSLFGSGTSSEVYQEMMDDHLAESVAKAGGFGLGEMIVKSMTSAHKTYIKDDLAQAIEDQTLKPMEQGRINVLR